MVNEFDPEVPDERHSSQWRLQAHPARPASSLAPDSTQTVDSEATDTEWLAAVARLLRDLEPGALVGPETRLRRLYVLADRLICIRPARTPPERTVLRGMLTELCTVLCEPTRAARGRYMAVRPDGRRRLIRPTEGPDPVAVKALAIIHARAFEERFRESDVARILGQRYWQVTSRLKTQLSWGFWEILNGLRVAKAAVLLVGDGTRPVAMIARDVGYTRASDLNRQFPRRFGCAPGEYRRKQGTTID